MAEAYFGAGGEGREGGGEGRGRGKKGSGKKGRGEKREGGRKEGQTGGRKVVSERKLQALVFVKVSHTLHTLHS